MADREKPPLFFPDYMALEGYERPDPPVGYDWVRDSLRRGWVAVYACPQCSGREIDL